MILVVDAEEAVANNLKELIEFMDAPRVRTAAPDDWRTRLGDYRLEALFVNSDLAQAEKEKLLADIGRLDPNVPIVMVSGVASQ